jgi:hypothetical protein
MKFEISLNRMKKLFGNLVRIDIGECVKIEIGDRFNHPINRARERYGLELTKEDILDLERDVDNARHLYKNVYMFTIEGEVVNVAVVDGRITTFLTR